MDDDGADGKPRYKNKMVQASLKNVQQQRRLTLEIEEIERQLGIELGILTRDKLDVLKDCLRLDSEKRNAEYLNDDITGKALQRYIQKRRDKDVTSKGQKENVEKFDFKTNTTRIYVKLPPLEFPDVLKEYKPHVRHEKPRLYRSNSIMRQRSASVHGLATADFSASLRESKNHICYTSLPDIQAFDKEVARKNLKFMPDIEEISESFPPQKMPTINKDANPKLTQRSRTIL